MSDIIKLLPEHVSNQIAAGEVIQRPASVIKELLDNAIDAGAKNIWITIKEGGKQLIQVVDDGKGMSVIDARLCWERHATSKINTAEDIFAVKTMGFRGEALASIASVAQVEMVTKTELNQLGTRIQIEGSEVIKQEAESCDKGTSITVKNLFYNIPARRNFLKSNQVETRHIYEEFNRAALAHPEIGFVLTHNQEEVYHYTATESAVRVGQVFGYTASVDLLTLAEDTTICNVRGFIGKPQNAKKTRGEQYFFVNNRFIKDGYLHHAVMSCYDQLISKEQFPLYVIYIEIDPSHIDVNVHPTKTEIKFDDERSVYQIIKAVCKKAIGEHYHVSNFEPASPDYFLNLGNKPQLQSDIPQAGYLSIKQANVTQPRVSKQASSDWQELFGILNKQETIKDVAPKRFEQLPDELLLNNQQQTNLLTLIHGTFILAQVKSGIILVNIQAAHERILYEKYMQALQNQPIASQQKLFPKTITLNAADALLLNELLNDIRSLGFDINDLGGNTFAINGLPTELNHYNEQHLIDEFLESYKHQTGNTTHQNVAYVLAQRAAVKAGTKLSAEEMNVLVDELFACPENNTSPSGTVCFKTLRLDDIYKILA